MMSVTFLQSSCRCPELLLQEGPEGVNGNWDLRIFGLGKWDLGYCMGLGMNDTKMRGMGKPKYHYN
jgi:hypothetical protein